MEIVDTFCSCSFGRRVFHRFFIFSDAHRLLAFGQHDVPPRAIANTPLYKGQVFAGSPSGRFVQFRDRKNIYLLEFPGRYHYSLFSAVTDKTSQV